MSDGPAVTLAPAPDGGAQVSPSREFQSSQPLDTMTVLRIEDEAECVINVRDFDKDLHRKVGPKAAPTPAGYASQKVGELREISVERGIASPEEAKAWSKAELITALEEDDAA